MSNLDKTNDEQNIDAANNSGSKDGLSKNKSIRPDSNSMPKDLGQDLGPISKLSKQNQIIYNLQKLDTAERLALTLSKEFQTLLFGNRKQTQGSEPTKSSRVELRKWKSGAIRESNENKSAVELVPPEPILLLGKHLAQAAKKYGRRNWEKGMPLEQFVASAYRHLLNLQLGKEDEDHAVACFCNLAMYIATRERYKDGRIDLPGADPETN